MRTQITGRMVPGLAIALALALGACTPDTPTRPGLAPGEALRTTYEISQLDTQTVHVPEVVGAPWELCLWVGEPDDSTSVGDCVESPNVRGTLMLVHSYSASVAAPTIGQCGGLNSAVPGARLAVSGLTAGAYVQAQFIPDDTTTLKVVTKEFNQPATSAPPVSASFCRK